MLLADIPTMLGQADTVAKGLEAGPIRYVAALSLTGNLVLLGWIARQYVVRVTELKQELRELSVLSLKLVQAAQELDRAMAFVMAQLPRKKGAPVLGPEPHSSPGRVPP